MNIAAEKADIIKRFKQVDDINLIKAIKGMLDFALERHDDEDDPELTAAIEKGLKQLENGEGIPHQEVMADLKRRYHL